MTVLLTGASGFLGRATLEAAQQCGMAVRPVFRSLASAKGHFGAQLVSGLDIATDWSEALQGVEVVIHAAARVHIMSNDDALDPLTEYRRVNVQGTSNLASQAAAAGVRRFVFISSIKVNGEVTAPSRPFAAEDIPHPQDAYGVSKAEAESRLQQLAKETGMEITVIRPPLVYGPGAKGNFASLLGWVGRGVPLPLGAVTQNYRSLVALDNLVDLILTCVEHPKAANQTFLVSDGEDLSTTELLQRIGKAMNRRTRLLPVPTDLLAFAARLLGKTAVAQRLLGSLQVDITKTCELLDWKPPVSVDEGLRRAMERRV